MTLILYALLTTALYYLASHAAITSFLWTRYPPALDRFLHCAACSGFWYGLLCGLIGAWYDLPFLGLAGRSGGTVVAIALGAVVWTPMLARWHLYALRQLGDSYALNNDGPPEST